MQSPHEQLTAHTRHRRMSLSNETTHCSCSRIHGSAVRSRNAGDFVPPVRLLVLLLPLLLLPQTQLLIHSTANTSAYDLTSQPFIASNSTIPTDYNQSSITWLPVFNRTDLDANWCTLSSWLENGCENVNWYSSTCIPLPSSPTFYMYGVYDVPCIMVSPIGIVGLGYPETGPIWQPSFLSIAQPDPRIEYGQLYLAFYNAQTLWNVISCNYSIIYANNSSAGSSSPYIFLIRGSFISFLNKTHPNSNTTIEWEVQLHSDTGLIIMHLISLVNATVNDLYAPISIGLASFMPLPEATMFINNEFVTNRTISRTLIWTPYVRLIEQCDFAFDCSECIKISNCYFCESTSACVDLGTNTTSSSNLISPHCPEGTVLSTCPASLIYSCQECVLAGNRWCSGEADCFVTMNTTGVDNSYCADVNAYQDLTSSSSWIPYCVGVNETCGQQTCNQLYQSQHSQCTVMGTNYYPPVSCQCEIGYDGVIQTGGVCNTCSPGYYKNPDDGTCAECPSVTPTLLVVFLAAGIVITFVLIKLNSHPLFRRLLVPIQNSIVYFQVVSLLELIDFHWPLSVRKALTAISIMGLNLFHLPSIDCYLTSQQTLTFTLIAPVFIGVLLFMCGIIGAIYNSWLVTRNKRTIEEAKRVSEKLAVLLVRAFITFLILFYNFLAWTLMDAYINDSIDWRNPGDELKSSKDLLQQVVGGTLIYLIGIPLLFWFLIFPRHKPTRCCCADCCCRCCGCDCMRPVRRSDILIPLISKYRPGLCQYWECTFVPLWKLLFNAIIVFGSGRNQQIALLSALLLLMICSYTFIAPYTSVLNNREQSWLMGGSLLILLSGLFFYESEPGDTTGKLILVCLSYFLIISTMVFMVLLMGYVMFVVYQEYKKEQAKTPGQEVKEEVGEETVTPEGGPEHAEHHEYVALAADETDQPDLQSEDATGASSAAAPTINSTSIQTPSAPELIPVSTELNGE